MQTPDLYSGRCSCHHRRCPADGEDSGTNIDGTYKLVTRVNADGTELRSPTVEGIYTLRRGHGSLNIFWKKNSATLASQAMIFKYSVTADEYCEWIVYRGEE